MDVNTIDDTTVTSPVVHQQAQGRSSSFSEKDSILPEAEVNNWSRRTSAFFEVGLGGDDAIVDERIKKEKPRLHVRFLNEVQFHEPVTTYLASTESPVLLKKTQQTQRLSSFLPRMLLLFLAIVFLASNVHLDSPARLIGLTGVKAGALRPRATEVEAEAIAKHAFRRQTTNVEICKRWAHQSALVNGTLFIYGGRSSTSASQTQNTWNDDFLTLDLTKSWQIASPSLTGLPRPSGPPSVALGALWYSTDNLYLYGGEFSDSPATSPVSYSTWSYNIAKRSWLEHQNPQDQTGQPVQRAAEGAGLSIPTLGRSFYLGGHLDGYTTEGWSQSIPRVYLESLLEYTMPGYSNPSLSSTSAVGADGAYRNLTSNSAGFPERADGVLVYVPGFGASGIVLGLAGGTNQTYTQMNVIDVYDIAESKWYKQATSGPTPGIRVNPCAVAVSAPDGSSTQVHMYGGQNLIPAGSQTQYDDMWILTIPSFTWIQVNTQGQSVPPARAGHTCNIWNGQMVVVGGYVGQDLSCDSPGIYVFNTSSLSWQTQYTALVTSDNLNRQAAQQNDINALQGSYGYAVPAGVQSAIGGNSQGAATVSAPAQTATQGPLVTGKPLTYSGTATNGAVTTATASSSPGSSDSGSNSGSNNGQGNSNNSSGGGTNTGAIIAGVIAGIFFLLACYLGFCAWIYRKQLKMYKNHVAMAQRAELSQDVRYIGAAGAIPVASKYSSDKPTSNNSNGDRFSSDNRSGSSGPARTSASNGTGTGMGVGSRRQELSSNNPYNKVPGGTGYATANSSTEDLMSGQEPSFLGVMLNPRRSLRVVNRD